MATITWAADTSGDFATKANWTGGAVPGLADTADIFTAGYNYFTVTSAVNENVKSLFTSNYATLDITGGGMTITNSLGVEGTVTVEAGVALLVGPTLFNTGEVDLAGKYSTLFVDSATVSLSGAGVINMAAGGVIVGVAAGDELFNASTIAGGGRLGEGIMALANDAAGVIDGSAGMELDASGVVVNGGLIEATGGGVGLTIQSTTLENRYGTLAANGGTLVLSNAVVDHGVLSTSGGGTIVTQGNGVILDGVAYGLTNAGMFQLQGSLGVTGTITNSGEFLEPSSVAAKITLLGNVSLAGAGTLAFNSDGINGVYSAAGKSYTLTNSSTISGAGGLGNGTFALTNTASGVIDAIGPGGAGFILNSNYSAVNAGLIEGTGGGDFQFLGETVNNAGGVILAAAGSLVSLVGGATVDGGAISIAAGGNLIGRDGVIDLTGGGSLTDAGSIEVVGAYDLVIKGGTAQSAGGVLVASSGGVLSLDGVAVLGAGAASSQLETVGASTIAIDKGSSVQIQGVQNNQGTIALASTTTKTELRVLAGGATLSSGGTITMSGPKTRILGISATATLTNANNTIVGVGSIGANDVTLINQAPGVIEATGLLTVRDAAGHALTNFGLMEANATGKLALVAETINQGGIGTIQAVGGLVTLQAVDVVGGTLTTTGAGRINVDGGGATLDGTLHTVTNSGLLQVTGAQTLTVDGNVANSGKLDLHAAKLLVGMAGVSLTGKGQVNLNDSVSNVIVGTTAAATLSNVDNRIAGSGHLGNGVMTLVNEAGGQIIGNQGVGLTIDTAANTIFNAGLIENSGKGGTLVKSAVSNSGTLAAVTAGTLTLQGAVTGAGVGRINGGTLYVVGAFTENVTFTGTTGVLKLGDSAAYAGQVSGLSKTGTNSLDLADIAFSNTKTKATYSGTTASGTLTVTDGTHTAHIALIGNYLGSTFTVSTDGHTGTKVVDPQAPAAPSASLAQAMAGFQHGPAAHLAATSAYSLPRFPMFHAQA